MPASKEALKQVQQLEENRQRDSEAKRKWDKLVQDYDDEYGTTTPANLKGDDLKQLIAKLAAFLDEKAKEKAIEPESR